MNKFYKKAVLALMALCFCGSAIAEGEEYALRLKLANGQTKDYVVAHHPTVTMDKNEVTISHPSFAVKYKVSEVLEYVFVDAKSVVDGINEVAAEGVSDKDVCFRFVDGQNIEIRGIKEGAMIQVYSVDGKKQYAEVTEIGEMTNVSLSSLPSGFYLINVAGEKSIKVMKK